MVEAEQPVILLTGAAGGLGRAIAAGLLRDGYRLLLTDTAPLDTFAAELGDDPQRIWHRGCDLSDSVAVRALAAEAAAAFGRIDGLVNNAALMTPTPFAEISLEFFQRVERVNVEAPLLLAQALAPLMSEGGRGRIVNVVSGSAWLPPKGFLAYITSKMALIGMTRALAVELGDRRITVNAITPGLTRHAGNAHDFPDAFWEGIRSRQAIPDLATPEDIVGTISFLLSRNSRFMTGQTLFCDGGTVFH